MQFGRILQWAVGGDERAGITVANLSVLKNNRARAVRFSTLTQICDVLRCQPGDLLSVEER